MHERAKRQEQQGPGAEDTLGGRSGTRCAKLECSQVTEAAMGWMESVWVFACVRDIILFAVKCLGVGRQFHVARLRFILIQRTIIVDLALPEKARINTGLINQL